MENYVFLIFLLLCFALAISLVKRGSLVLRAKLTRFFIVLLATIFFSYWFAQKSVPSFVKDSLVVQIINKLPQPIDFYLIRIDEATRQSNQYVIKHSGKVRPEHYRIEYLKMDHSDEYWIVGYLGKKNLVYFSQHSVPNKNIDQIIEIRNYINQSQKLSDIAGKNIDEYRSQDMQTSVWITLSLLLIFLNIVLLARKK